MILQGFGETDYDYYDDTDPLITGTIQFKIPVEASKRPPGPGFGGPEDFGETNSEVILFFINSMFFAHKSPFNIRK